MSIVEKTMYTVKCDGCDQEAFSEHDITAWEQEWYPQSLASETLGWIEHEDKHYCPNCSEWNETETELGRN